MYEKSIELLNKAAADELFAVHQYMYFHFHCEDQGYDLLAALFIRTAIEEMTHIERCAERIIFLGGDVEMVASNEVEENSGRQENAGNGAENGRGQRQGLQYLGQRMHNL